ncbi:hypothetical protein ACFV20_35430 [Streptomyces sp. NPDC059696]|uniref:hypothetical protein n=1 Tax=Streptomyces sp. NPDC059696 TaxID=3346911 RepID=UPI0036C1F02B
MLDETAHHVQSTDTKGGHGRRTQGDRLDVVVAHGRDEGELGHGLIGDGVVHEEADGDTEEAGERAAL